MIDGGADPKYLSRRLVRMAVEDIGLADPRATDLAVNGADIYERLGSPEGELALAQAVVYMACAAKSNAVYNAYNQARKFAAEHGSAPVPIHLRNAPTKLMKQLGHGLPLRSRRAAWLRRRRAVFPRWIESFLLPADRPRAGG